MSINSFGRLLRFTSWGESHGEAIGGVLDGCPPGIAVEEASIQHWLDRRRPGTSALTSPRQETDRVKVLSGLFEGLTTGTPISFMIANQDARPSDYAASVFRPGHADWVYQRKYGHRDWRGGGRASARETATRVAAGAIARLVIPEIKIVSFLSELGGDPIDRSRFDADWVEASGIHCPDREATERWRSHLETARAEGSSLGAVVECVASGAPPGWGAPVYARLDAELGAAMLSINAAKGVEIGDGFAAARLRGEENADAMAPGASGPEFLSNHAGGILGGISTGQPIVLRIAFKPASSIARPLAGIDTGGNAAVIATQGRHDPCVALRATAVVEAMVALVLADHKLLHRAQCGRD